MFHVFIIENILNWIKGAVILTKDWVPKWENDVFHSVINILSVVDGFLSFVITYYLFKHYLRNEFVMLWIAVHNVIFVMFLKQSVET
jgi:hypothetical protein